MKWRSSIGGFLCAILIAVQTISIAHAYEHDPGSLGHTACATCISIAHLAAAAVDTGPIAAPTVHAPVPIGHSSNITRRPSAYIALQRGPPAPA